MLTYLVQGENEFTKHLQSLTKTVTFENDNEKESFRKMVFTVQGAVEDILKLKWKNEIDFTVGWDFNYCRFTCGGVYSRRIFCEDYVKAVHFALSGADREGIWVYHTVCEILVNPDGKTSGECNEERGEFIVIGQQCVINGDSMKKEWRSFIGCDQ